MSDTDGPAGMDKLRDEIIEAQRGHLDMVKWKIMLVAALGAVGLGFQGVGLSGAGGRTALPAHYVLCLIPFVCAYCDLMLCTLLLRMRAIGAFIRHRGRWKLLTDYEDCIASLRRNGNGGARLFGFEEFAVFGASYLFSGLVALVLFLLGETALSCLGLFGLGCTRLIQCRFHKKSDMLDEFMHDKEAGTS